MSQEILKTVTIDRDGVAVDINESDLQENDVIWQDKPAPKSKRVNDVKKAETAAIAEDKKRSK